MKRMVIMIAVLALATAAFAQSDVRISQVYGGGGSTNTAATFNQDFVEIFNAGEDPVDISGWYLEYGSATGNWGSSTGNMFQFPEATVIAPCSYLLVACGTAGSGGAPLPYYDFLATINAAAVSGKFGLFNELNFNLACGAEIPGTLVDKVAYGTANCWEGSAAVPALSVSTAAIRNGGGLVDTDDNAADFTVDTPDPRWSGSPLNADCLAVSTEAIDWSTLKRNYR
jgi:uncharacterized protein